MTRKFTSLPRTAVLSIGITLVASTIAAAQTTPATLSGVATPAATAAGAPMFALQLPGRNVWITADGARVRGFVTSLSPAGLVLVEDGISTTIAYDKVVRVEKSSHRLRNGTLIGLASGVGFGLVMGAMWCGGDEYCGPGTAASTTAGFSLAYGGLGAAAGLGIGAIVNAARKHGDVLYDARRSTKTMSLAPIFSPTRKGMAFSMTWR